VLARLLNMPTEKLAAWMKPGRYVSGHEMAAAGLAELVDLVPQVLMPPQPPSGKRRRK
jgi:hypothetical protein